MGRPGKDAPSKGDRRAVQFWSGHDLRAAGERSKPTGELYAETAEGRPGQGMPAYRGQLQNAELWDVALLLQSAGADLPEPVGRILRQTE